MVLVFGFVVLIFCVIGDLRVFWVFVGFGVCLAVFASMIGGLKACVFSLELFEFMMYLICCV